MPSTCATAFITILLAATQTAAQDALPEGVQLVHSGGECLSDDVDLGSFDTLSECADACVASTTGSCFARSERRLVVSSFGS